MVTTRISPSSLTLGSTCVHIDRDRCAANVVVLIFARRKMASTLLIRVYSDHVPGRSAAVDQGQQIRNGSLPVHRVERSATVRQQTYHGQRSL